MEYLKRTWANVSLDNLEHNYHALRKQIPDDCRFLGVVKADAYGHGAVPIGRALGEMGADYLAVSNLEEAIQLRRGGVELPILILGYTPAIYADVLAEQHITQEVHALEYARELENRLAGTDLTLKVHLKLDTGMTRIGFFAYDNDGTIDNLVAVSKLPHLYVEGAFMHFSVSDSLLPEDVSYTRAQFARFTAMLQQMADRGIRPEIRHCANSGATLMYPEYALDMVRPGVATYGLYPSPDAVGTVELKPLMSVHTSIAQLRTVPAGTSISYGRTFAPEKDMRMAVLTIGYADGLCRAYAGKIRFCLHGHMVPVVGRICMDMCMVDVTDVPDAQVGDELTLFGYTEDGTLLPCERLSDAIGTISYEVVCSVNKRVPRLYQKNGRDVDILQYIV